MSLSRNFKKIYWFLSGKYAIVKYPVNKSLIFVGVTGTDGKTTTSSFIYEIAKAFGYKPLLLTTVSAKFDDRNVEVNLKSMSFFAYSIKNVIDSTKKFNIPKLFKNLFFLDKSGYDEIVEAHRTTPLASEIRKLIREYETKGANFIILETTSHALDQYRVAGIEFDSVAYTNITSEHLDYHGSWRNYAETKSKLIKQLKPCGAVSVNRDDTKSYEFLSECISKEKEGITKITYYAESYEKLSTDKFFINVKEEEKETLVFASEKKITENAKSAKLQLFGKYNIYNSLAALSAFLGLFYCNPDLRPETPGEALEKAVKALSKLKQVEGRMNFLSDKPIVIVDFAHTPNAVEKALSSANLLKKTEGARLWVVFGTAGLRDKYKRPAMGKIAYNLADNILITSEDPRTESVFDINNQIIRGFKKSDGDFVIHSYFDGLKYEIDGEKFIARFDEPNINSRRNAIRFAMENAMENDIVIILGKGHETTMAFGNKEYDWNDIDEVNKILEKGKEFNESEENDS